MTGILVWQNLASEKVDGNSVSVNFVSYSGEQRVNSSTYALYADYNGIVHQRVYTNETVFVGFGHLIEFPAGE